MLTSESQPPLDLIEATLHDLLPTLLRPVERTRGRPEILPSTLLWTALLVGFVRGVTTQRGLWQLLSQLGLWNHPRIPISTEGVRQRLVRSGSAPMQALFVAVTAELAARTPVVAGLAPQFAGIYAIDDTTLDQVARTLPALRDLPAGDERLLPGKLCSLLDLRTQQFVTVLPTELPHQNPKVALPELAAAVPAGSLLLFDLGYFSFERFDALSQQRQPFVSRLRAKTSTERLHTITDEPQVQDAIVWLGKHRANQAGFAVRLIEVEVAGVWYRYLTNVLDPAHLSVADVVALYARRWDIEVAFKTLKVDLGLGMLWSAQWELILIQVWGALIVFQIAQSLRLQIAARAEVDPFDVSLRRLLRDLPQLMRRGENDPIGIIVGLPRGPGCFLRPSSRSQRVVPLIHGITAPPADLIVSRVARYAGRKTGPNHTNQLPRTVDYGIRRLTPN